MSIIAVYNMKGGVGKTTLAVNLAWCSAVASARRTLLWDLDPQAAATYLIGTGKEAKDEAQAMFAKLVKVDKQVRKSTVTNLDLLAADASLRGLDRLFLDLGKKKRLKNLLEDLQAGYDRIILDCPPGLSETSEQILRAATLVIVPVIPSPLAQRAFHEVRNYIDRESGSHPPLLPVHSMVDRRRVLHREALAAHPDWPVIPMASAVERMSEMKVPLGAYAPRSPAALAVRNIWTAIEKKLAKG